MKKSSVGATILAATLVSGLAIPAQAAGLPGADPADGSTGGTVQAQANAVTPAAAAKLRPPLRLGTRSPAVVYVQTALGVKPASGYYGPLTAKAVRALQKRHGLKATGRVSTSTWKVLGASPTTSDPAPLPNPGNPPAESPTPEQAAKLRPALARGARGPAVVYVQQKLGVTPSTGFFGAQTTSAVKKLQKAHGVRASGVVGPRTWTVLHAAKGLITLPTEGDSTAMPTTSETDSVDPAKPSPEQAAASRPPLSIGAGPGDPAVVFVQKYLEVAPATGYYGTLTTAAVRAYQTGLGMPVTGAVDAATWDALLAGRVAPPAPQTPTPSATAIPTPTHALPKNPAAADLALVFALAQVGKPYVLGGNGPAVFDCSGLVQQAYLTAGVKLPRLASQQRFAGTKVKLDALRPGDLLYYQDGSSPRKGHISMYAGNGLVVEAANPRRGVRIRTLHEPWYRDRFVAAVRIG